MSSVDGFTVVVAAAAILSASRLSGDLSGLSVSSDNIIKMSCFFVWQMCEL